MHAAYLTSILAWTRAVAAVSGGSRTFDKRLVDTSLFNAPGNSPNLQRRQNANTSAFAIDGSKIPGVDFTLDESYAGLLPISSDADEKSKLYFWYFPSTNKDADDEITIWLNGGPGCSSLEGFMQENGPLSWKPGTYKPVKNRWSWHHLTNMVWVDQPVTTGFSQGPRVVNNQEDLSRDFMGWLKNFIDTFGLHGRKIYLTGESYAAGMYIPYMAYYMLEANDKTYYNLQGTLGYSPALNWFAVTEQIPSVPFIDRWAPLLNLNSTFVDAMHNASDACGHTKFLNDYLTFPPPPGPMPDPPDGLVYRDGCDTWTAILNATFLVNPCFNIYHIPDTCPFLWDILGSSPGPDGFFNRSDVQAAINAPPTNYILCNQTDQVFPNGDASEWSSFGDAGQKAILPQVIERSARTMLVGGDLDFIIISDGVLLSIQNMTWNGAQGFQQRPSDPFIVPYDGEYALEYCPTDQPAVDCDSSNYAAVGVLGVTHTERGLTWVNMAGSGHMGPRRTCDAVRGPLSSRPTIDIITARTKIDPPQRANEGNQYLDKPNERHKQNHINTVSTDRHLLLGVTPRLSSRASW
ncbi:unnamed protein product [Zymoseptoria tritici ST99CH_1E4]|uniref:Carboxypeptidase n=1 Tax=Zymoseptoria tritici ST99CH_1E4 TaxID=1276532 RepID=A0A2H1GUE0_ZYMTR|nr:unnamed protein product [Zymoseptoria tritici ST99CH_1E4]